MAYTFKLPDVGEGMAEGEIVRLLVQPGDTVAKDQPVIEVQTDKVSVELPSPVAGVVKDIPVQAGEVVPVGNPLLILETDEADGMDENGGHQTVTGDEKFESKTDEDGQQLKNVDNPVSRPRRVIAAPATRRLARELKVDIEQVQGTGPRGRVTDQDVRIFASGNGKKNVRDGEGQVSVVSTPAESASAQYREEYNPAELEERIDIRGIRKQIAEKMVRSKSTIPHVTHFDQVDVTELIDVRKRLKDEATAAGVKLTYLPFIVKAVTFALREFPVFNAMIDDDKQQIVIKKYIHIGIATDTEDGLVVPVIRDADRKSLLEIAREIESLSTRARNKALTPSDLSGGTFTISNVGGVGGMFATPVINHPEVAILATHKIEAKPVVVDREKKEFDIRDFMTISLSFDHRIIDGVQAVKFSNRIRDLLQEPLTLMLRM